jgi:hypothetical protein
MPYPAAAARSRESVQATGPLAPLFVSAEVGNVNATTTVVTFSMNVAASGDDFLSSVTIKVNGSPVEISAAEQQTNHAVVHYTIPAVLQGDAVTWEYAQASGHIRAESGGDVLEDVTPQAVTNNVAGGPVPLLDLEADTQIIGVIPAWIGEEAAHNVFAQSDSAKQPVCEMKDGKLAVYFAGADIAAHFLTGPNIADNLDNFAVFVVSLFDTNANWSADIIGKISVDTEIGWHLEVANSADQITAGLIIDDGSGGVIQNLDTETLSGFTVAEAESIGRNAANGSASVNGLSTGLSLFGTTTNYSTTALMTIGASEFDLPSGSWSGWLRAVRIYQITDLVNWPTDRATIITELAARYGITL